MRKDLRERVVLSSGRNESVIPFDSLSLQDGGQSMEAYPKREQDIESRFYHYHCISGRINDASGFESRHYSRRGAVGQAFFLISQAIEILKEMNYSKSRCEEIETRLRLYVKECGIAYVDEEDRKNFGFDRIIVYRCIDKNCDAHLITL